MANAREYTVVFAKTFCRSVWKSVDIKKLGIELASVFIGAGYFWWTNGFNAMIKEVNSFVWFSLPIPVLLALAFIGYHFIHTPVKIYSEQKKQIDKLRTEYEIAPEKVNLQIQALDFPEDNAVGICITNPTQQKITDLSVKLQRLARIFSPNEKRDILKGKAYREFCSDLGSGHKDAVPPGDSVVVQLAKLEPQCNDRISFLLGQPYPYLIESTKDEDGFTVIRADFEIHLRITGMAKDIAIPVRTFKAPIHFQGAMPAQAVRKGPSDIKMPAVPTSITIGPEMV